MIVISLTDCPLALRGDLSKWLQEINTGVYVGQVSTRVREEIWKRVKDKIKSGRATMVFNANNEQRMDFRVHNTSWEPIDFDGLKLMLRPSPARLKQLSEGRRGFSSAAQMQKAKQLSRRQGVSLPLPLPASHLFVDILTTGPSTREHEICEIEAFVVKDGKIESKFHAVAREDGSSGQTFSLTKTMDDEFHEKLSLSLAEVISDFTEFAQDLPVISHREDHVYSFLRAACAEYQLPRFSNRCIDTLDLARRKVREVESYHLDALLRHLGIAGSNHPDEISNCVATKLLYEKLMKMA